MNEISIWLQYWKPIHYTIFLVPVNRFHVVHFLSIRQLFLPWKNHHLFTCKVQFELQKKQLVTYPTKWTIKKTTIIAVTKTAHSRIYKWPNNWHKSPSSPRYNFGWLKRRTMNSFQLCFGMHLTYDGLSLPHCMKYVY